MPRARVARTSRRRTRAARRRRSGSRARARDRRHPRRAGRGTPSTSRCSGARVQGLALVASGAVAEGMRALDEVNTAVVAGELTDLVAIGLSCCYMIAACDRVRDYDRAVQWCTRLKAFCPKWGLRPLFAVCRTQYASICMWRGTWLEAEQELASRDRRAGGEPAGDDGRRPRAARRTAPAAGPARRGGVAVRAVRAARACGARTRRARLRPRGCPRRRRNWQRATCAGCPPHNRTDRATGLDLLVRAPRRHRRSGRRRHRARRADGHRGARRHRAAARRGEPRRRLCRAGPTTMRTGLDGISKMRSICSGRAARRTSWRGRASSLSRSLAALGRGAAAVEEAQRAIRSALRAEGGAGDLPRAGRCSTALSAAVPVDARPRGQRRAAPRASWRCCGWSPRGSTIRRSASGCS